MLHVAERGRRRRLRHGVGAEGLADHEQGLEHRGRGHGVAGAQPPEPVDLREGAGHDHGGPAAHEVDPVRVVGVFGVLEVGLVEDEQAAGGQRGHEGFDLGPPVPGAGGVVGVRDEDEAGPRVDRPRHGREVVRPLAHRHEPRAAVVRRDDLPEADEGVLGDDGVVAGAEEGAGDQVDDLDRPVPGQDVVHAARRAARRGPRAARSPAGRGSGSRRPRTACAASTAFGDGPSGFSFDASLTTSVRPSSRCTSPIGLPGSKRSSPSRCAGKENHGGRAVLTAVLPAPARSGAGAHHASPARPAPGPRAGRGRLRGAEAASRCASTPAPPG